MRLSVIEKPPVSLREMFTLGIILFAQIMNSKDIEHVPVLVIFFSNLLEQRQASFGPLVCRDEEGNHHDSASVEGSGSGSSVGFASTSGS